jgi:hypothetical protein
MLKVEIHLEISVPSDHLNVNQIVALSQEVQAQVGPALVAHCLETVQDLELDRVLGAKWADASQDEASWVCPQCHSRQGFSRRGSRPRALCKTSVGRVSFNLRQVTCHQCNDTFAPFSAQLGLEPYQVSTSEFQAKAVRIACQTSYARSVAHVHDLGRVKVSATAVHNWVQDKGRQVAFAVGQADGHPLLLDSTKVRTGDKQRGCSLNLGLSVQGRCWEGGRPRLKVAPVCFGVGESWSQTGQALAGSEPARILFDGDEGLANWLGDTFPDTPKQRGVWHVVSQFYWPLWEDGLNKTNAKLWMGRLGKIIYHPEHAVPRSRAEMESLIAQLHQEGLANAARYLEAAAPHVFTYREQPDGMFFDDRRWESCAISSTSPLERQMREINRRTDVGVRWSTPGAQNLVGLDLVRRFDSAQWATLWRLSQPDCPEYSVVKLQVRVQVVLSLNVKTT